MIIKTPAWTNLRGNVICFPSNVWLTTKIGEKFTFNGKLSPDFMPAIR